MWNAPRTYKGVDFVVLIYEARTCLGGCRTGVRHCPTQEVTTQIGTRLPVRRCHIWAFFLFLFFMDLRRLSSIRADSASIRTEQGKFSQNQAILPIWNSQPPISNILLYSVWVSMISFNAKKVLSLHLYAPL